MTLSPTPDTSATAHPEPLAGHGSGARLACAAVICLAGAVYLNALNNPFVYDDHRLITENRSLVDVNLRALLFQDASRPVINVSYAVDRAVWGDKPFGFHLTNVLLHMLNVGLFYALSFQFATSRRVLEWRERTGAPRPHVVALTAAALFAVHPMLTEAVGYISGRSEVLCGTFFLLALLCAGRWMRGAPWTWLLATFSLWLLALGTKEIAVMFPLVVFAFDRWILGDAAGSEQRRRLRYLHIPLLVTTLVAVILRMTVFTLLEHGGIHPDWRLALVELDITRRYLWMLIAPSQQMIFHTIDPISSVLDPRALGGLATVAILVALAWRLRKGAAIAGLGFVWFLALLAPSSLLIVLGRGEPMAEHRVYLASCGFFLTIGAAIDFIGRRLRPASPARWMMRAASAVLLLQLCGRTLVRNEVWKDPVALWDEAAVAAPDHWVPYVPLGEELHRAGRHEDAVNVLATAIRLKPTEPDAYKQRGVCLLETGKLEDATAMFQQLERINPQSTDAPFGLGLVAIAEGRNAEARELLARAVQRDPSNMAARHALEDLENRMRGGAAPRQ